MNLEKDYDVILELFKDRIIESVASTYLIDEWDFDNNNVDPKYVNVRDTKTKYSWLCPNGHEPYESYPYNRFVRKTGCKKCSDKNAIRHNKRRVKNLDTGEIFESIADAERAYGKEGNTSISLCCRKHHKGDYSATAYKQHWCYYNEDNEKDKPEQKN